MMQSELVNELAERVVTELPPRMDALFGVGAFGAAAEILCDILVSVGVEQGVIDLETGTTLRQLAKEGEFGQMHQVMMSRF